MEEDVNGKVGFWAGLGNVFTALGGGDGIFGGIASIIGAANKKYVYTQSNSNINVNPAMAIAVGGALLGMFLIFRK